MQQEPLSGQRSDLHEDDVRVGTALLALRGELGRHVVRQVDQRDAGEALDAQATELPLVTVTW